MSALGVGSEQDRDRRLQNKEARLNFLCEMLGIDPDRARLLRYQLVHRTCAALIEAKRFGAKHAAMIVHSFSNAPDPASFGDFQRFAPEVG